MKDLIIAGPYSVQDIHVSNSPIVAGIAPPTAMIGFAEALNRDLGPSIDITGVGIVVHSHSLHEGHAKYPPKMDNSSDLTGSTVVDEIRGRATMSFIFEVSVSEDEEFPNRVIAKSVSRLPAMILRKRFSSGSLHPVAKTELVRHAPAGERAKALKTMPFGYLLTDRRNYLEERAADGIGPMQAVMDASAIVRRKKGWQRLVSGALSPISVGYLELNEPRKVNGGRSENPNALHSFVETLTSVGEWVSTKKSAKSDTPLSGALWAPFHDPSRGIYYASATGPLAS